ncbi:MAG: tetratricopeptide repeat protein, partial [SAR324 cluster bacterium]|nr:tetratricopeptide repeat protein [SAR324 cluster bacterium]
EEGLVRINKAIRLSPIHGPFYEWALSDAYWVQGRHDEAIAALEKSLERNPDVLFTQLRLAAHYSAAEREEEARSMAAKLMRAHPEFSLSAFTDEWGITMIPYRDRAQFDRLTDSLHRAGLR